MRGTASASLRSLYQLWVILQIIIKLKKRVGWIFAETMRLAKISGNLLHSISMHSLLSNVGGIAGSVDTHIILSSGNRTILSRMGAIWLGTRGTCSPTFSDGGDITCHVPPLFPFRLCIWRGFKDESDVLSRFVWRALHVRWYATYSQVHVEAEFVVVLLILLVYKF